MITKNERAEALAITQRVLAALLTFNIAAGGGTGADLRSAIGKVLGNFFDLTASKTIGTELQNCFSLATTAGATLASMDNVRISLLAETPLFPYGTSIVNASVIFSLAEQCQIIAVTEFVSRIEAEAMIDRMTPIIEDIKLDFSELFDANDYQNVVQLSALLIQHLSATVRQLPRVVNYTWPVSYPSLTMANRIYGDGSRSDELVAENKTVHPLFMAREVIALSA